MNLIDIIMPNEYNCMFCGRDSSTGLICTSCYDKLPRHRNKTCIKCGGEMSDDGEVCIDCKSVNHVFDRNFSILKYEDDIRQKIVDFKIHKKKYIGKAFADIMLDYFKTINIPFELIIPVPIHANRLKERGFNQSEILVKDIAEYYGRVYTNVMERIVDTPHQTGLDREHRQNNLEGAFRILDKKKVKNKIVLLIDDIYTTGSTIDECAKTLKKAGALEVYSICLARPEITKKIASS